jgi:hypothetical protein
MKSTCYLLKFFPSGFINFRSLNLHPLSNIPLPERLASTAWEPSTPEIRITFLAPRNVIFSPPSPQFFFYISLSFALCALLLNFFVFCAIIVVLKESRLLVLHRTSYNIILSYRLLLSSYLFLSDL